MQKKIAAPLARLVNALDGWGWDEVPQSLEAAFLYLRDVDSYLEGEGIYFWSEQEARDFENARYLAEKVDQLLHQCGPQSWWVEDFLAQAMELQELFERFISERERTHENLYPELDRLIGYLRSHQNGLSSASHWPNLAAPAVEVVKRIQEDLSLYASQAAPEVLQQLDTAASEALECLNQSAPPRAHRFEEICRLLNQLGEWNLAQTNQPEFCLQTVKNWRRSLSLDDAKLQLWLTTYHQDWHPTWLSWWQQKGRPALVPREVRHVMMGVIERKFADPDLRISSFEEATNHLNGLEKVLDLWSRVDMELKDGLDTPLDISIQVLNLVYRQRLPIRSLHKVIEKFQQHNLTGTYARVSSLLEEYFETLESDLLLEALELLWALRPLQFQRPSSDESGPLEFFAQNRKKFELEL